MNKRQTKDDLVEVIGSGEAASLRRAAAKSKVYRKQLREVNRALRLLKLEYKELKSLYDSKSLATTDAAVPQRDDGSVSPPVLGILLTQSFVWNGTPQGHEYWEAVAENLRKLGEKYGTYC